MKVAVAWGTEDAVLPYGQTDGMPENITLHTISGAGHMLAEEAPEAVIGIIRRMIGIE
jgi:pyruvate dehydrogenase E2 component (dihydrolipoamide acetyltransferase)